MIKSSILQPRLLYPAKVVLRIEGQIKSFPHKKQLKEFITTKPVLFEMLKSSLRRRKKIKNMNIKIAIYT